MKPCWLRINKCFLCEDKMIPKNAELRANADRAALAKMVVKAGPPRHLAAPPLRRGRGVPQRIEGRGNFLVQNASGSSLSLLEKPKERAPHLEGHFYSYIRTYLAKYNMSLETHGIETAKPPREND